jgi:hypothetical protein
MQDINTTELKGLANRYNINFSTLLHQYLPKIVSQLTNNTATFMSVGEDNIICHTDNFPFLSEIELLLPVAIEQEQKDIGVFERTYDSSGIVRETYSFPAERAEALEMLASLPSDFSIQGAFSIGKTKSTEIINDDYITVYYVNSGVYPQDKCESYAFKISLVTKEVADTKFIKPFNDILSEFAIHFPANTNQRHIAEYENNKDYIELYFTFNTETEYQEYLKENYHSRNYLSKLGSGVIGLTIRVSDNSITRIKRYFF